MTPRVFSTMKHLTPRVSNEGPDSTGFLLKDRFCSTEQIASATIGKCDVGADCQGLIAENATMKDLTPRVLPRTGIWTTGERARDKLFTF